MEWFQRHAPIPRKALREIILYCCLLTGTTACVATDCVQQDISCSPFLAYRPRAYEYMAYNGSSAGVYAYSYNAETGALTSTGSLSGVDCTNDFARHPSLPVVYCLAVVGGVSTIQVVSVNRSDLSLIQSIPLANNGFVGLYPRPSGDYLVLGDGTNTRLAVFAVDSVTGSLSFAYSSAVGTGGAATAFSRGGEYLYSRLSGTFLYEYRFSGTGLTQTGAFDSSGVNTWNFLEARDSRYLYGSTSAASVYRFAIAGGAASNFTVAALDCPSPAHVGGATVLNDVSPDGRFFFVNNQTPAAVASVAYDSPAGNLSVITNLTGVLYGRTRVSPDGKFLYSTVGSPTANLNQYDLFTVSSEGVLTRSANSPITTGVLNQSAFVFIPFVKQ